MSCSRKPPPQVSLQSTHALSEERYATVISPFSSPATSAAHQQRRAYSTSVLGKRYCLSITQQRQLTCQSATVHATTGKQRRERESAHFHSTQTCRDFSNSCIVIIGKSISLIDVRIRLRIMTVVWNAWRSSRGIMASFDR